MTHSASTVVRVISIFGLSPFTRFGGISYVKKVAEKLFAAFDTNICRPFVAGLVPSHTLYSAGIVFPNSLVLHILGARDNAKILNPIVQRVSVDVINLLSRPLAGMEKPENAMGVLFLENYPAALVPFVVDRRTRLSIGKPAIPVSARTFSGLSWGGSEKFRSARQPIKLSGVEISLENTRNVMIGGVSHD